MRRVEEESLDGSDGDDDGDEGHVPVRSRPNILGGVQIMWRPRTGIR